MTALFSRPKLPSVPSTTTPTVPTITTPVVQQAGADQLAQQAQALGRASTILTSGQGDTSSQAAGRKMLLGQ